MVERSDQDGQPEEVGFNWARRRDRGTDELIGLCRGVLADGVVVIEEAKFMHDWLVRNEPVRRTLAGRELYETLCKVLVHGQMDPVGESALVDLCYAHHWRQPRWNFKLRIIPLPFPSTIHRQKS